MNTPYHYPIICIRMPGRKGMKVIAHISSTRSQVLKVLSHQVSMLQLKSINDQDLMVAVVIVRMAQR